MTSCRITNVRVLDGTGREPFAGSVRVEGNRIAEVSAGAGPAGPPADRIIDGRGATLMPGLIEPHAHLSFADVVSYELTRLPPEEHLLATIRNARTMLDSGYTGALSAAPAKPRPDVGVKRQVHTGRAPPPRAPAHRPPHTAARGGRRHARP